MGLVDFLKTFVAAMTPVGELRFSIPLAIYTLNMHWASALAISLAGNMVPVIVLTIFLHRFGELITSFPNPIGRLLTWRRVSIEASSAKLFSRYRSLALMILVAIPLPLTGAWTGILAAWAFQIPPRVAIPTIASGLLISGTIVTIVSEMGIHIAVLMLD